MPVDVTIGKMQKNDIPTIRRIGFTTPEFNTGSDVDQFYSAKTMRKWINDPNGIAFSALANGKIIGFVLGNYLSASRGGYINTMVVNQKHRGHGIGKELLRRALEELRSKDCAHVFCSVEEDNKVMLNFMRKSGFQIGKSFKYVETVLD